MTLDKPKRGKKKITPKDEGSAPIDTQINMSAVSQEPMSVFDSPKYVGHIAITPTFHVYQPKKPNWLHRFMMKHLLGWEWHDQI